MELHENEGMLKPVETNLISLLIRIQMFSPIPYGTGEHFGNFVEMHYEFNLNCYCPSK